ncbi:hypothetical protein VPNG_07446 [Cytospora leucostoma]|uniref:Aminoglycoside phosphotransferase domain-containing protein n=1 Tax=Cytospora leucostoma TaxID=1230097 RepID=A0A423WML4_9PEZI|nr:hypothetical protein VPNG_07446 [Cytospora leucostoma]
MEQKLPVEMATDPASIRSSNVDAFFERCGLPLETRERCWAMARGLFPGRTIDEVKSQGYCSYTLLVGQDTIVQFRPPVHRLDIRLTTAAQEIYGSLAPRTELLGWLETPLQPSPKKAGDGTDSQALIDEAIAIDDNDHEPGSSFHVYCMTRIPGVSLAEVLVSSSMKSPRSPTPCRLRQQRETIVENFADFIAVGWKSARPASDPIVSSLCGRVGCSIRWRLEVMSAHLPRRFRSAVREALDRLGEIESLPWALTHGDVRPANMMMMSPPQDSAGVLSVSGFLDWAEAEYLPLGTGLYGLEELLGENGVDGRFSYYMEADDLREVFWSRLAAELPGINIQNGTHYRDVIGAAHILGVLLWHGIAFDNGRLNRVVEEGKDDSEIWRLDIFFNQFHSEESQVQF